MQNNGEKKSFLELISEHSIFIPKIQRDYIQYRANEVNLDKFLDKLINALLDSKQKINLNFIYGYEDITKINVNTENEKILKVFIPIDGQQRITTLFLLYLSIFGRAKKFDFIENTMRNKLIYDTRESTSNFINKLFDNIEDVFNNELHISVENFIKNSSWYEIDWDYDSSIKSIFKVLELINKKMNSKKECDWNNIACELENNNTNISFMKMIISINKGNEFYIKINSRGRQLTQLENFKADMLGFLKANSKEDLSKRISKSLDNEWLSFINEKLKTEYYDQSKIEDNKFEIIRSSDILINEIYYSVIRNKLLLTNGTDNKDFKRDLYFDSYMQFFENKDLFIESICDATSVLNKLYEICSKSIFDDIWKDIFGNVYYKKEFSFEIDEIKKRAFLFAFTIYSTNTPSVDIEYWWRIVRNLINNAEIDKEYKLKECMSWFDSNDLITFIKNENYKGIKEERVWGSALRVLQLEEESEKFKLLTDSNWKNAILDAESIPYFNGEIYFLLKLSVEKQEYNLEKFNKYKDYFKKIFNEIDKNSIDIHSKLLSYCFYPIKQSEYNGDYILDFYRDNEPHHNGDWRGLLRDKDKRLAFKKFLDEEPICDEVHIDLSKKDMYYLIKFMSKYKYRIWHSPKNEYFVLKTLNRGRCINIKLAILYEKLIADNVKNVSLDFSENQNKVNDAYIKVNKIKIRYVNSEYYIDEKNRFQNLDDLIGSIKK